MATALAGDDLARSVSSGRRLAASASGRSRSFREAWQDQPDAFSRNGRQDDDEEELLWTAIERLPTYDRLRKSVLTQVLENGKVKADEIDVKKLGVDEKKQLMDSILKVVEEDNERFLKRLRQRTDKYVIKTFALLKKASSTVFSIGNDQFRWRKAVRSKDYTNKINQTLPFIHKSYLGF